MTESIMQSWTERLLIKELVNSTNEAILLLDCTSQVLLANNQSCTLLGYSEDEILESIVYDLIPSLDRKHWARFWHKLNQKGSWKQVVKIRTRNDQMHLVQLQAKMIGLEDQTLALLRLEANAGAGSDQLAQLTFSNMPDMIYLADLSGQLCFFNDAVLEESEYEREELISFNIWDVFTEFSAAYWQNLSNRIKVKKRLNEEVKAQRKDGSTYFVDIIFSHIQYPEKEYICAFARDITQRKRQDEQLRVALEEINQLKDELEAENNYLQEEIQFEFNYGNIISANQTYRRVLNQIREVAPTSATVLIIGETGTGKELLARAIHQNGSRKNKPLVKVNCATLPENLIESELFGHERGAFTGAINRKIGKFELADSGTIFLDEIGEMPLDLQAKLLRVLQEKEVTRLGSNKVIKVDTRVIAATNRNLEKMVAEGTFREDLFYRLNVFPIENIPLRERKEDIPLLVKYCMEKTSDRIGKKLNGISKGALNRLTEYDFPGNIRELENIIERAMILSKGQLLDLSHWFPKKNNIESQQKHFKTFAEMQKEHIINALRKTKWKISGENGAAKLLNLNAKTLESKMRKLNIKRIDFLNM